MIMFSTITILRTLVGLWKVIKKAVQRQSAATPLFEVHIAATVSDHSSLFPRRRLFRVALSSATIKNFDLSTVKRFS